MGLTDLSPSDVHTLSMNTTANQVNSGYGPSRSN